MVSRANLLLLTASVLAMVGGGTLLTLNENTPVVQAALLAIIAGTGAGFGQTLGVIFAQKWVEASLQPTMVSFATMVQQYGGALGLVMGGVLLNTQLFARLQDLGFEYNMIEEIQGALVARAPLNQMLTDSQAKAVFTAVADSIRVAFWLIFVASILQYLFVVHIKKRRL